MFSRNNDQPRSFFGNTVILLLAGIVMICTAAILPAVWDAAGKFIKAESSRDPHQCLFIHDDSARLRCFEERIKASPAQPAKGAFAPTGIFGGTEK